MRVWALWRLAWGGIVERWVGSLHAGALVKGLYLRWALAPRLRRAPGVGFDAGCGPEAAFARLLAHSYPGWRIVGLDLKLGDDAGNGRPRNLILCRGDLRSLPLTGPFDFIYSVDVLEHLDDPEACLARLVDRLAAGGWLLLLVPSLRQRHFLPGVDRSYSWLGPPAAGDDHLREGFEPEELAAWLRGAGCEVLTWRFTFGPALTILKELFMLGEERRIPGIGLALSPLVVLVAWLERWFGGRKGNGLLLLARRAAG